MAKAKTFAVSNNPASSDVNIEFKFRIRDMEAKKTKAVTVLAKDVMTASNKVAKAVKDTNKFVILSVTDSSGAQYVGKQLIKLNDNIYVLNSTQIEMIKRYAKKYDENAEDIMHAISQMVWKRGISAGRAMERVLNNVVAGADLMDENTAEEIVEKAENAETVVDENTADEIVEKAECAETVVDGVYNKYANENDKEFLKSALKEMNRYLNSWEQLSMRMRRDIAPGGKNELKEHIKNAEARLAQLTDSQPLQDAAKYFRVTYKAGENVYSAVMVGADTEELAKKKFIERKPTYADKIVGVTETQQGEVDSMRKRGMSVFDNSCDVKDYGEFENIEFDSSNDNMATNEVLFKYSELNGVNRRNINGMTELNFGGDWYKAVHTRVVPIGGGATYFIRMQKIRDAFNIPSAKESLARDYKQGKITIEEVAEQLYEMGYTTYSNNIEYAKKVIAETPVRDATDEEIKEYMKKTGFSYVDAKRALEETETEENYGEHPLFKGLTDSFSTTDIVNRGSDIIRKFYNNKKPAHEMLESPFMKSTYFKLDMDEPQDAKAEININYEPDFDDNSRGWFVIESFVVFKNGSRTKITTRTADTPDKAIQALKEAMSKMSHSFRDSKMTCEGVSTVSDAVELTTESGTDRIIYVMQSDVDKNLYFYIGQKYSMKDGVWTYAKFKMNGTTPDQLKSELEKAGWHAVGGGPASIIDSKEGFENYLDVYDNKN